MLKFVFSPRNRCERLPAERQPGFSAIGLTLYQHPSLCRGHPQKPNIVILLADDLDWHDVGYHGGPLKTPHIDQLAEEGLELNRFYVAPLCSPSRAGLMTGVYPHRLGFGYRARPMPGNELPANARTLATMLAEAGYKRRAFVGKWHLQNKGGDKGHPLDQGFTEFYGLLGGAVDYFSHETISLSKGAIPTLDWYRDRELNYDKGYTTDLLTNESVRIIRESAEQGPFFVYVAFNAPHLPLQAKGHTPEIDWAQVKDRQSSAFSQLFDTYRAMVSSMDEGIGKILTAIDKGGLRDNTLVLFLSDNGGMFNLEPIYESLSGHKGTAGERGIKVPALLRWPRSTRSW